MYTGRTTRGLRVVLARRRNHLHLVRLTRWQLSRAGSTQYAMELTILRLQRCRGLLQSPWCSSSFLEPVPRCLPTSTVRPGAAGLVIGIECSRVRNSSWMYLIYKGGQGPPQKTSTPKAIQTTTQDVGYYATCGPNLSKFWCSLYHRVPEQSILPTNLTAKGIPE